MQIYTIYKITNNLNDKSYIGFDSNYPNRIRNHKKGYLKITDKTCVFYKALKKYGWDNFSCSIVYQSKDKTHTLNVMENYFIMEYKTYIKLPDNKGYNMTIGGDGVLNAADFWTEDRKKKQSLLSKERFLGIPKTVEHKINMRGPRVNFNQSNEKNNTAQKIKTPYGIFDSIKTAELYIKQLDINTNYNKIYYNLNNINVVEWSYVDKKHQYNKLNKNRPKNNKKPIKTPYGQFSSIKEAIQYIIENIGIHTSYDIIKARLKSDKYNDWNYL